MIVDKYQQSSEQFLIIILLKYKYPAINNTSVIFLF